MYEIYFIIGLMLLIFMFLQIHVDTENLEEIIKKSKNGETRLFAFLFAITMVIVYGVVWPLGLGILIKSALDS